MNMPQQPVENATPGYTAEPTPQAPPLPNQRQMAFDPRRKSPILASFLSCAPGLGQVYIGYYQRGFVHLFIIAGTITLLAGDMVRGAEPLFGLFLAFFWLYNIIDAGRRAAFYNHAIEGGSDIEFPVDMKLPGTGGSLVGGVVLIAGGLIFLSHTALGFSLNWLEVWWPAIPVLFGIYLVVRSMQGKAAAASE